MDILLVGGIVLLFYFALLIPTRRHPEPMPFSLNVMVTIILVTLGVGLWIDLVNRGRELIMDYVGISVPRGYLKPGREVVFFKDIRRLELLGEKETILSITHKHGKLLIFRGYLPEDGTFMEIYERLLSVADLDPEDPMEEVRFSYKRSPALSFTVSAIVAIAIPLYGYDPDLPIIFLAVEVLILLGLFLPGCWVYLRNRKPREIVFGPVSFSLPESYLSDALTVIRYQDILEVKEIRIYKKGSYIRVVCRQGQVDIDKGWLGSNFEDLEVLNRLRMVCQRVAAC